MNSIEKNLIKKGHHLVLLLLLRKLRLAEYIPSLGGDRGVAVAQQHCCDHIKRLLLANWLALVLAF